MSYAIVFSVLLLVLALGATVGTMVWWVRRPLPWRRASGGAVLPLFSHEHAAVWSRTAVDDDDDRTSSVLAARQDGATATMRYQVPTEATLQFLPGRLEVLRGPDAGQELRFVRQQAGAPTVVTLGRSEGPPYGHVQLHDATVSRQHAQLSYRDGAWWLRNLSDTNPARINGSALTIGEQRVADGDRIELGNVSFRYRP